MAQDFIVNVTPDFDMVAFSQNLAGIYRTRGFNVNILPLENGCMISLTKDTGGANTIIGLGVGIKVTLFVHNNILSVSFSDEEWVSKITAICVGFFFSAFVLPLALVVTGIIGVTKQMDLSKTVHSDITVILSSIQYKNQGGYR